MIFIWTTLITWSAEMRYGESGCLFSKTVTMKHASSAPPSQCFSHYYNFLPWGEKVDTTGLLFYYFIFYHVTYFVLILCLFMTLKMYCISILGLRIHHFHFHNILSIVEAILISI